jgi:hypothetical protein
MTKGTLNWYQWCCKIGRKEYLRKSNIKTKRFYKYNPNDLQWRVFKTTVLKGKNVSPELMLKFKKLIEVKGSVKFGYKYKHLSPKELFNKMKG